MVTNCNIKDMFHEMDVAQNLQNCKDTQSVKETKIIMDYNKFIYETYVLPLNVFCMCLITNICHSRSDIKGKRME